MFKFIGVIIGPDMLVQIYVSYQKLYYSNWCYTGNWTTSK